MAEYVLKINIRSNVSAFSKTVEKSVRSILDIDKKAMMQRLAEFLVDTAHRRFTGNSLINIPILERAYAGAPNPSDPGLAGWASRTRQYSGVDGKTWEPLSEAYARRKEFMFNGGKEFDSIGRKSRPHKYAESRGSSDDLLFLYGPLSEAYNRGSIRVDENSLEISPNTSNGLVKVYAGVHNNTTDSNRGNNVPGRPFLFIDDWTMMALRRHVKLTYVNRLFAARRAFRK